MRTLCFLLVLTSISSRAQVPHGAPKDSIPLNIDYMMRGYYYASSPYRKDLDGPGGHAGSSNGSAHITNSLPVKASTFQVFIDTTQKCRWAQRYEGIRNSYHQLFLSSGEYWRFNAPVYHGKIATRIRVQLLYKRSPSQKDDAIIYSNIIEGHVNPGQFGQKKKYHPNGIMDPYHD